MNSNLLKKAWKVLADEGLAVFAFKTKFKLNAYGIYKRWYEANERDIYEVTSLEYNPLFSVVIPVYNVEEEMLTECIESVLNQTYKNLELILVDDASTMPSVRTVLSKYEDKEKVTIIYRTENGHISKCTNDGINAAKGEFVALCDCDDLYAPNALFEVAKKLNEDRSFDFIYSDEDKINEKGTKRMDPFFKPDWSPETFMSYMYTCHLAVYRTELLKEIGGLRTGFDGSQDYDLVLRIMEKTTRIGHVPKILYHWRMRKQSTASSMAAKPYVMEATQKAKNEALERRGLKGSLTLLPSIAQYRVTYEPIGNPKVSIIIPSKDNPDVLKMCLESIENKTSYPNFEVVLVDNGSNEENKNKIEKLIESLKIKVNYIYKPMEFNFSRMCNVGVENATGEYFLFLNDDIEISENVKMNPAITIDISDWLKILVGQASVSYTGAVGCKLYYPDSIVFQHAGVVNYEIGPGHCLYGMKDNTNYYYGRNLLDYNFTVVTGACLVVNAEKYHKVGGFDEDLSIAYNDVALCFALKNAGYHNVLRNDIALVHHESVSRGLDSKSAEKEERRKKEAAILYDKYPEYSHGYDPCYNPNLVSDKGDFSFNMKNVHKQEPLFETKISGEKTGNIVYSLDSFMDKEDKIILNGWAYDSDVKNNNLQKIKIAFVGDNKSYAMLSQKTYRRDVAMTVGRKRCTLVGFEAVIEKTKLPKGTYNIGLLIGSRFKSLNKEIII